MFELFYNGSFLKEHNTWQSTADFRNGMCIGVQQQAPARSFEFQRIQPGEAVHSFFQLRDIKTGRVVISAQRRHRIRLRSPEPRKCGSSTAMAPISTSWICLRFEQLSIPAETVGS